MRHEASFLKDILIACGRIDAIVASTSEESFLKDVVLTAAVLHHLAVIGEAISRLSIELRQRHPPGPVEAGYCSAPQNCPCLLRS